MNRSAVSRIAFLGFLAAGALLSGCSNSLAHQGYVGEPALVDGIQAGLDTRESVEKTLGRPSFTGQFDQRDWYYVSRVLTGYAYKIPKPKDQTVLHIRFDDAGNVVAVDKAGMDKVAAITPNRDKTATLGRHRTILEDLLGGIGQVGATGKGGTADNPTGQ